MNGAVTDSLPQGVHDGLRNRTNAPNKLDGGNKFDCLNPESALHQINNNMNNQSVMKDQDNEAPM